MGKKKLDVEYAIKGLTGQETATVAIKRIFCDLCSTAINSGEIFVDLPGKIQTWKAHQNCAIAKMCKMHNLTFLQDAKMRTQTKRVRKDTRKIYTATGKEHCSFCRQPIKNKYVKSSKHLYCYGVKHSCWTRNKRIIDTRRRTIAN